MHSVEIIKASANENREAWLAIRRKHVTATDWPKITGTSRWGSACDVIDDKRNDSEDEDRPTPLPMYVGSALEPLIIKEIKKEWGPGNYLSQWFLSRKHLGFTPDLAKIHADGDWELAEIKVSVKEWGEKVPPDYLDQVEFQATVLGVQRVHIVHLELSNWGEGLRMFNAGMVPTDRLELYPIDVSSSVRRRIERQAETWWASHMSEVLD
jgi:predicted phage-related endonuclease